MNKHVPTFMTGLGVGATAVLLLDPEHGTERRRLVRDKTLDGIETARRATAATRELGSRGIDTARQATALTRELGSLGIDTARRATAATRELGSRLAELEQTLRADWQGRKREGNGWSPAGLALMGVGMLTFGLVASRGVWHRRRTLSEVSLPRDAWRKFLEEFTERHLRRLASIEVQGQGPVSGGISSELPLIGVSIDGGSVIVSAGEQPDVHISHVIPAVEAVTVERYADGAERGLRIGSGDGTTTLIRLRSA